MKKEEKSRQLQPYPGTYPYPISLDPYWNSLCAANPGDERNPTLQEAVLLTFFTQIEIHGFESVDGLRIELYLAEYPDTYVGINYEELTRAFPILGIAGSNRKSLQTKLKRLVDNGYLIEPQERPNPNKVYLRIAPEHLSNMLYSLKAIYEVKANLQYSNYVIEHEIQKQVE